MLGRLIKIFVFTFIVCYFIFYKYNSDEVIKPNAEQISHLSTLLVLEQHLQNTLTSSELSYYKLKAYSIPYVEGQLISLSQITEQIVLAEVKVRQSESPLAVNDEIIFIAYTGLLSNEDNPRLNATYYWLIAKEKEDSLYYYLQLGKRGIIAKHP